jgi:hypothetical protein
MIRRAVSGHKPGGIAPARRLLYTSERGRNDRLIGLDRGPVLGCQPIVTVVARLLYFKAGQEVGEEVVSYAEAAFAP